jgi:drug/metabolite transporter (DMT)-like permease
LNDNIFVNFPKHIFIDNILPETTETDTKFLTEGVRAMFLSSLAFALANIFVKKVTHIPVLEIVFFRCTIGVFFSYAGLKKANADWRGSNRKLLLLRGLFGTTALVLFFLTLQKIPLASAMTIQYLSPIFTTIIAIFLLKENVKYLQWLFYALAFTGVLFIERFDPRISLFYLVIGIFSAFCSGMAYNLVRSLREREHPLTVVMHFQIVGLAAGFISLFFDWRMPSGWDWFYLALIGISSQLGQIFLTNAFQKEKASGIAIIAYSGLIYGLTVGWLVFDERQTPASLLGMFLVVCGVILSVIYGKRNNTIEKIESSLG